MVDTPHDLQRAELAASKYSVIGQFLTSKTGHKEDCEDTIYLGPHFVAVIDGATSKAERRWNGETGGRVAAKIIRDTFDQIPHDATARQAVDILTSAIKVLYEQYDLLEAVQADPVQRAVASFVAVSLWRKEIWFVGDCQCMLNQKIISNTKEIDTITSNARSLFLESEIDQGKTIEELRQHDTGREFILPLLERQMLFQNNPSAGQYWFSVIDGLDVPDEGIRVVNLPEDIETIILASDGYPYLKENLEASEQALKELLYDDPLLFRRYKSTKGMKKGNISYDDRAYVKLKIER